MFSKKAKKPANKTQVQFVFIEESVGKVGSAMMKWQDLTWWPKKPGIKIKCKMPGPIEVGKVLQYKLTQPLLSGWTAEVVDFVPNRKLESTFKSGLLQGIETIQIEERANGTKLEYRMDYQVKGFLNKIFWAIWGERAHANAIKKILEAFRDYVLREARQEQERRYEGQAP